ncbi:MAG: SH3 domain-containing protein [Saprospiraceae bacterium]|nr:SH3 domain-containing protein [Saprospiraceae bacterium]
MLSQYHYRSGYWEQKLSFTWIRVFLRFFLFFILVLPPGQSYLAAQSNLVLYNMQYVPQSHQLNPGQMPYMKWHLGIPALSSIRLGIGSTGFDYDRINAQIEADEATYSTIISPTAPEFNRGVLDFEWQLLNFGFQFNKGASYLSFDVADAFYASGNYTRDFARMFEQIENNELQGNGSMTFDQSRQNFNLAYYRGYSVGFTQQVNRKLSLGVRARYLQGILSLKSENQSFGFYYPGDGTTFEIEGQLNVMTAGRSLVEDIEGVSSLFPAGNGGFAFDLGGLYRLNDKWEFSFAIQQLGQISWNQDVNYTVIDDQYTFSAVDIDDHMDTWSAVADSLLDGQGISNRGNFTTALPQRYFIGANYFFSPNSSVGLLINPVSYYQATDLNLALSLQTRLAKIFGVSAVFGYSRYADFNVGTGLSLELGPFQIYALTEALFSTPNWRSAEFGQAQLGINLNFGRYKRSDIVVTEAREDITNVALVKPASNAKEEIEVPADKPAKTRPSIGESPAAETGPQRLEQVSPSYYLFTASIANLQTGLRVERAKYEVYVMAPDGQKELLLIGSVMDGKFSVELAIDQLHVLKLLAQGYQEQEVALRKVGMEKSQTEMRSQINLVPKEASTNAAMPRPEENQVSTSPPVDSLAEVAQPVQEAIPITPIDEEIDAPEVPYTPTLAALSECRLSRNTSLRKAATHTSDVILRLKAGDEVVLLEKTSNNWWKVKFKEQVGYAKAALMDLL